MTRVKKIEIEEGKEGEEEGKEGRHNENSAKGYEPDAITSEQITSEISSLTKTLSNVFTALFNKKSEGISNDVKKFQNNVDNKINDNYADLSTGINTINENID